MAGRARPRTAVGGRDHRAAVILLPLGAWTIVVPYLGHAIGLGVNVAGRVEVVDHVVPGAVVAIVATYVLIRDRGGSLSLRAALLGGGVCFLAGFWVLATHVPLVGDAASGRASWGAAVWHASTALPLVGVAAWWLMRTTSADASAG